MYEDVLIQKGRNMIEKAEKEDLCQISLTGIRSLVLLSLLIKAPMSLEEIRNAFIGYKIMEGSNSDDILRIDINTLKAMGCVISRADHRTNKKYVLIDHPFKININKDEVNVIKRAFNKIKEKADINLLLLYDNLFKKIAPHIADNEVKEILLGISPLKKYSLEIIDELKIACDNKNVVKLVYKSSVGNKEDEKEIFADCIKLQNDKLYLYGVDKNSNQPVYLNVRRILKIISKHLSDETYIKKPVVVRFMLKEFGIMGLEENEEIESGDKSAGYIIRGQYHNSFYATQRMLSFGSKCTILEPEEFREKFIEILKSMKEVYND